MNRRKVIARVVDPGECRYYRKGRSFVLGGFTPKGLCDSAFAVLSRDAQTLACGGRLPWQKEGRTLTRCPDPRGALWELCADGQGRDDAASPGSDETTFRQVEACRGQEGGCRFALVGLQPLKTQIECVVRDSGWRDFLQRRVSGPPLPHQRLRIALAACPNGCTQPQIKDIALVANLRASRVGATCTACGRCQEVCEEGAIVVGGDAARLDPARCVGCGVCVRACPAKALETEALSFRILVGGRLGRHPRWATELPVTVSPGDARDAVEGLLQLIMQEARPGDRVSDVVEGLGVTRLAQALRSVGGM